MGCPRSRYRGDGKVGYRANRRSGFSGRPWKHEKARTFRSGTRGTPPLTIEDFNVAGDALHVLNALSRTSAGACTRGDKRHR